MKGRLSGCRAHRLGGGRPPRKYRTAVFVFLLEAVAQILGRQIAGLAIGAGCEPARSRNLTNPGCARPRITRFAVRQEFAIHRVAVAPSAIPFQQWEKRQWYTKSVTLDCTSKAPMNSLIAPAFGIVG